jgi:hypothetical protein
MTLHGFSWQNCWHLALFGCGFPVSDYVESPMPFDTIDTFIVFRYLLSIPPYSQSQLRAPKFFRHRRLPLLSRYNAL